MTTDDQSKPEPSGEGTEPSPVSAYAGAVKMIAPDTLMPQRDRAPYRALIGDDFLRPKVEGEIEPSAAFVCDLCGAERQLSDARAHVLKSHTEAFAERVITRAAGLSFIAAHGTVFGDDYACTCAAAYRTSTRLKHATGLTAKTSHSPRTCSTRLPASGSMLKTTFCSMRATAC
jgi:hypothetical protein